MNQRSDTLDAKLVARKHTNDEMQKFVKEISSAKGYKNVSVRNQQAQRSLNDHERKIDVESRQAAQKMTKKQRELSDQLHALELEKEKIALRKLREQQVSRQSMRTPDWSSDSDSDEGIVNPYPVALKTIPRTDSVEKLGMAYARGRAGRRRLSREFEDLDINTSTGALLPRLHRTKLSDSLTSLLHKTPSSQNLSRDRDADWMGRPEAIGSVRRSRKTAEQLQRDALMIRVTSATGRRTPTLPRKADGGAASPMTPRKPTKLTAIHREDSRQFKERPYSARSSPKTQKSPLSSRK